MHEDFVTQTLVRIFKSEIDKGYNAIWLVYRETRDCAKHAPRYKNLLGVNGWGLSFPVKPIIVVVREIGKLARVDYPDRQNLDASYPRAGVKAPGLEGTWVENSGDSDSDKHSLLLWQPSTSQQGLHRCLFGLYGELARRRQVVSCGITMFSEPTLMTWASHPPRVERNSARISQCTDSKCL